MTTDDADDAGRDRPDPAVAAAAGDFRRDLTSGRARRLARRWVRQSVGTLLGLLTGPLLALGWLLGPRLGLRRTARWDFARLRRFHRLDCEPPELRGRRRPAVLLLEALLATAVGVLMFQLVGLWLLFTLASVVQLLVAGPGSSVTVTFVTSWQQSTPALLFAAFYVVSSAVAVCLGAELAGRVTAALLGRRLTVRRRDGDEDRIGQLITTRRGVVAAVDEERRRIERDLHDGVQQRAVSLSMLVARAERSAEPGRSRELLGATLEESQELIGEMREVAWRVYPVELDELGLDQALVSLAQRSPLDVRVDDRLTTRPSRPVEVVVYFIVREAVTNAVKHAGASGVDILLERRGDRGEERVVVSIADDGRGGADPQGAGLRGLARRVEALDGAFRVESRTDGSTEDPRGGATARPPASTGTGTRVTAELPDGGAGAPPGAGERRQS
ncbi:sensor histidine kinase [Nesterenkonia halobia]|uniref:histidine kinase n=1 Tax=Nesterenkonia halobia TaxID=37922 RepID=A0ABP6R7P4_9MICC